MVLESLINPKRAIEKKTRLFFVGFLYATVAVFLSYWIFKEYSSLIMVFLTVMAAMPFVYFSVKDEEEKGTIIERESSILKEHSKTISCLVILFLGFVVSFSLWYIVLPADWVYNIFQSQTTTIININSQVSGKIFGSFETFSIIFLNNIKVMMFCILFSFLYGIGAMFILVWNASVISTAIGNFIRTGLMSTPIKYSSYFYIVSLGFFRYMTHGIFEIVAYFIAGLAGGIISVAVIREKFGTKEFEKIVLDSSDLIIISVAFILVGALVEVYITPLLFY